MVKIEPFSVEAVRLSYSYYLFLDTVCNRSSLSTDFIPVDGQA